MSHQLNMQKGVTVAPEDIAMPPIQTPTQAQTYEVHPSLAAANTTLVETPDEPVQQEAFQQEEEIVEEAPVKKYPSDKDDNMRIMRENWKKAERERDEAMRMLQERQAAQAPLPEVADEDIDLAPDALAEGKHLSKMSRKVKDVEKQLKNYEMQFKKYQEQASSQMSLQALKSEFPDIEKVCSQGNIEKLMTQYPLLYETVFSNPDIYKRGNSTYTLIKQLGIHKEDVYAQDRERAQKNAAKPKPLAAIGAAINQQGGFQYDPKNEDSKKRILEQSRKYADGY